MQHEDEAAPTTTVEGGLEGGGGGVTKPTVVAKKGDTNVCKKFLRGTCFSSCRFHHPTDPKEVGDLRESFGWTRELSEEDKRFVVRAREREKERSQREAEPSRGRERSRSRERGGGGGGGVERDREQRDREQRDREQRDRERERERGRDRERERGGGQRDLTLPLLPHYLSPLGPWPERFAPEPYYPQYLMGREAAYPPPWSGRYREEREGYVVAHRY